MKSLKTVKFIVLENFPTIRYAVLCIVLHVYCMAGNFQGTKVLMFF